MTNNGSESDAFAPINNLSTNEADSQEVVILVPDAPYLQSSAQAFMQAFYPPHSPETSEIGDWSQVLSNGVVVDYPLSGYKYPTIHTASDLDPNSIFVAGSDNCVTWSISGSEYMATEDFSITQNNTNSMYDMIGIDMLNDLFPEQTWGYYNA